VLHVIGMDTYQLTCFFKYVVSVAVKSQDLKHWIRSHCYSVGIVS